jgi:hypothetical protein
MEIAFANTQGIALFALNAGCFPAASGAFQRPAIIASGVAENAGYR